MVMFISIKKHRSNIWSSAHEKVKQHGGWVEKKSVAYKKSVYCKIDSFHKLLRYQNYSNIKKLYERNILIGFLTYVSLFIATSTLNFKASVLNWSHVFNRTPKNMWHSSPPSNCANKIIWKIPSLQSFWVEDSNVHLLHLLPLFVIIRNTFERWKNTEVSFWKEKQKTKDKNKNRRYICTENKMK